MVRFVTGLAGLLTLCLVQPLEAFYIPGTAHYPRPSPLEKHELTDKQMNRLVIT